MAKAKACFSFTGYRLCLVSRLFANSPCLTISTCLKGKAFTAFTYLPDFQHLLSAIITRVSQRPSSPALQTFGGGARGGGGGVVATPQNISVISRIGNHARIRKRKETDRKIRRQSTNQIKRNFKLVGLYKLWFVQGCKQADLTMLEIIPLPNWKSQSTLQTPQSRDLSPNNVYNEEKPERRERTAEIYAEEWPGKVSKCW